MYKDRTAKLKTAKSANQNYDNKDQTEPILRLGCRLRLGRVTGKPKVPYLLVLSDKALICGIKCALFFRGTRLQVFNVT